MLEFTRTQRLLICGSIGLLLVVLTVALLTRSRRPTELEVSGASPDAGAPTAQVTTPLTVHVTGCVCNPGVYRLQLGARVLDAVTAAGGFAAGADEQTLNLAAFVTDGQRILIPLRPRPPVREPSVAPAPATTAGVLPPSLSPAPATNPPGATGARPRMGEPAAPPSPTTAFPLSINRASVTQLQAIPSLGPVLAARIVAYRTQYGPFQRIEDLARVPGVGPKRLTRIAPYVTL